MAIMKVSESKATHHKGLAYILDPSKTEAWGYLNMFCSVDPDNDYLEKPDPNRFAKQMIQTQHIHHKGFDVNERKYYHYKISFHPDDREENGGPLTPELADKYARKYAEDHWPGREVVWSVHCDGKARHIHFIVNAVEMETGKKLDVRDAEWRQWKDDCQELCRQFGLQDIDWRKATREKRDQERFVEEPIEGTFAEKDLRERGKYVWKDELRDRIDAAVRSSCSMDEFKAVLESQGVTLTRCTGTTISYKMGTHKACRGDTLGGDYTMAAIQDALQHNVQDPNPQKISLSDRLAGIQAGADVNRVISPEERQMLLTLGRLAGVRRSEIDEMCDRAPIATWEEKQAAWAEYKAARDEFWEEYNIRNQAIQKEINEAYKRRKKIKEMEWILNPRNRRKSLMSVIYAAIFFSRNDSLMIADIKINQLKREQEQLRKEMATFKATTGEAVETLREKGHSVDAYMASVKRMQKIADDVQRKNAATLDPAQREQLHRAAEKKKQTYRQGR